MDFALDAVQEDVRKLARTLFDDLAQPARITEVEKTDDGIDRELWAELARSQLLGIAFPEDVGGSGHGILELAVLCAEMGRRVAPVPLLSTIGLAGLPIAAYGTQEQRKRFLAPVLDGTSLLTAGLQESARHDPLDVRTTATRDGSGWRLDGLKVSVPHAPIADRVLVTARTGEDAVGLFLVDPGASGVRIEPSRSTHRELQGHLALEGASVGEDDVIGPPDAGTETLLFTHRHALACMCATAVGVVEEAIRITASYISTRHQFGKPLATFQGATLKAADAYIDAECTNVTTWSAIWKLANGAPDTDEALAIAKFWVADGGQRVVHICQHLHGGMGVDTDYPIHRYFLWAKQLELAMGGSTPQLLAIGDKVAGG